MRGDLLRVSLFDARTPGAAISGRVSQNGRSRFFSMRLLLARQCRRGHV